MKENTLDLDCQQEETSALDTLAPEEKAGTNKTEKGGRGGGVGGNGLEGQGKKGGVGGNGPEGQGKKGVGGAQMSARREDMITTFR